MNSLAKSIYQTLAFFDAEGLPLTLLEIRGYLVYNAPQSKYRNVEISSGGEGELSLTTVQNAMNNELASLIGYKEGFYFLIGRGDLVHERKKKYRISLKNFRLAKKYLSQLRFFPYLRSVTISGSLALLNSTENSDIDLFVITKANRIWLTRLLVSMYFQMLGRRRYGLNIPGRFCLNHYVCEDLTLEKDRNLYTAVEYASLIPILGYQELQRFWERNKWIKDYGLIFFPPWTGGDEGESEFSRLQRLVEFFLDFTLGPPLNYLSGLYQKRRIRLQEHILVSDAELSFHPGSRGQKVLANFSSKIADFLGLRGGEAKLYYPLDTDSF